MSQPELLNEDFFSRHIYVTGFAETCLIMDTVDYMEDLNFLKKWFPG